MNLPMFDMVLRLAALYARLEFRPRPTLVEAGDTASKFSI
jgi:hypothetical protein